jgi:hypothetical protein
MRQIAVGDAETNPFKYERVPRAFIWGFYDGVEYRLFDRVEDFILFVMDKPIIVFFHNGGRFDYHLGFKEFLDIDDTVKLINGRIAQFFIGKCEFRDSMNILPVGLATFQKTRIGYEIFEEGIRDKPENKVKITNYLKDDLRDLFSVVTDFINRFGLSLTLAGCAMRQWEKLDGQRAPNDEFGTLYHGEDKEGKNNFKRFYYGGRTEALEFGVIKDDFILADINSSYPRAMLDKHPYSLDWYNIDEYEFDRLDDDLKGGCFFELDAVCLGAFPYRSKDGSLFFPRDYTRRRYYVTGWEFLAAIDTGVLLEYEIINIFKFVEYKSFKKYILLYYDLRQKAQAAGDKAGDIFYKLLMNNLYGKYGANPDEYEEFIVTLHNRLNSELQYIYKDNVYDWQGDFGPYALCSMPVPKLQQRYYNVATAGSITGNGRAFLWRSMCKCSGAVYGDTDSILARNISQLPNGFGKNLGQWEIEGKFSEVAISGKKLYSFKYTDECAAENYEKLLAKLKGEKPTKQEIEACYFKNRSKGVRLTTEELYRVARGEVVEYLPEVPVFSPYKAPYFQPREIRMRKSVLIE